MKSYRRSFRSPSLSDSGSERMRDSFHSSDFRRSRSPTRYTSPLRKNRKYPSYYSSGRSVKGSYGGGRAYSRSMSPGSPIYRNFRTNRSPLSSYVNKSSRGYSSLKISSHARITSKLPKRISWQTRESVLGGILLKKAPSYKSKAAPSSYRKEIVHRRVSRRSTPEYRREGDYRPPRSSARKIQYPTEAVRSKRRWESEYNDGDQIRRRARYREHEKKKGIPMEFSITVDQDSKRSAYRNRDTDRHGNKRRVVMRKRPSYSGSSSKAMPIRSRKPIGYGDSRINRPLRVPPREERRLQREPPSGNMWHAKGNAPYFSVFRHLDKNEKASEAAGKALESAGSRELRHPEEGEDSMSINLHASRWFPFVFGFMEDVCLNIKKFEEASGADVYAVELTKSGILNVVGSPENVDKAKKEIQSWCRLRGITEKKMDIVLNGETISKAILKISGPEKEDNEKSSGGKDGESDEEEFIEVSEAEVSAAEASEEEANENQEELAEEESEYE